MLKTNQSCTEYVDRTHSVILFLVIFCIVMGLCIMFYMATSINIQSISNKKIERNQSPVCYRNHNILYTLADMDLGEYYLDKRGQISFKYFDKEIAAKTLYELKPSKSLQEALCKTEVAEFRLNKKRGYIEFILLDKTVNIKDFTKHLEE